MGKQARLKRTIRRLANREIGKSGDALALELGLSTPPVPEASPWLAQPAGRRALLEQHDNFAGLRNGLRKVADSREDWAGIPMPMDGERLIVEPTYPKAKELMAIGAAAQAAAEEDRGFKFINSWYSSRHGCDIIVFEVDGKRDWGVQAAIHHFGMDLRTLGASDAWGIEQESAAVHTLATLVSHRQFKQYMLTGMFIESSKRSRVPYVFRRLRPTVALGERNGEMKIRCVLCLHPIAYYAGTWAGAMCPTDDVIAHLMLMRGDEVMFWRRANQHPAWRPEAGL